jgi:enoyl-CoA hydratase
MTTDFTTRYERLTFKRHPEGILEIVMGAPGKLSTADHVLHREIAEIWLDVDRDPQTRVAILRGEGKGFSAGGDMKLRAPNFAPDSPF